MNERTNEEYKANEVYILYRLSDRQTDGQTDGWIDRCGGKSKQIFK